MSEEIIEIPEGWEIKPFLMFEFEYREAFDPDFSPDFVLQKSSPSLYKIILFNPCLIHDDKFYLSGVRTRMVREWAQIPLTLCIHLKKFVRKNYCTVVEIDNRPPIRPPH